MSSIISFLENMGRDAVLRHATQADLGRAMERERIEPALRAAILGQDRSQVDALLGVTHKIHCLNFPAKTPKKAPGKAPGKKPSKAPGKKPAKKPAPAKKPSKAPARKRTQGAAAAVAARNTAGESAVVH